MFHFLTQTQFHGVPSRAGKGIPCLLGLLRDTFIRGPRVLFTSRIDAKCAFAMALMCSPALLFSAIYILPAILFRFPHQNAYYYFSGMLEQDPSRWYVLIAAGVCAILSLAIPATIPEDRSSVGS
jgi:hypothetical protein